MRSFCFYNPNISDHFADSGKMVLLLKSPSNDYRKERRGSDACDFLDITPIFTPFLFARIAKFFGILIFFAATFLASLP